MNGGDAEATIVVDAQCLLRDTLFSQKYEYCKEFLTLVDAKTEEVIAVVEDEGEGKVYEFGIAPSWDDAVDKLASAYRKRQ